MSVAGQARRFEWSPFAIALAAILGLGLLPLVSVSTAALISDANGCAFEPVDTGACMVQGSDWSVWLAPVARFGLLTTVTLPLGSVALCIWTIALILTYAIHRVRRQSGVPHS